MGPVSCFIVLAIVVVEIKRGRTSYVLLLPLDIFPLGHFLLPSTPAFQRLIIIGLKKKVAGVSLTSSSKNCAAFGSYTLGQLLGRHLEAEHGTDCSV